jgi:hypothetical protein
MHVRDLLTVERPRQIVIIPLHDILPSWYRYVFVGYSIADVYGGNCVIAGLKFSEDGSGNAYWKFNYFRWRWRWLGSG